MAIIRDSSAYGVGVEVAVYNLAQVQRALKSIAPQVEKDMNRSIREALNVTRDTARARIPDEPPMSGWRTTAAASGRSRGGAGWPAWNPSAMRAGIKVATGTARGRRLASIGVAWRLESKEGAATIFDKATNSKSSVGAQFVSNLNSRHGEAQRVLWPAWLATRADAMDKIQAAIREGEQVVQSFMDQNDGARSA